MSLQLSRGSFEWQTTSDSQCPGTSRASMLFSVYIVASTVTECYSCWVAHMKI